MCTDVAMSLSAPAAENLLQWRNNVQGDSQEGIARRAVTALGLCALIITNLAETVIRVALSVILLIPGLLICHATEASSPLREEIITLFVASVVVISLNFGLLRVFLENIVDSDELDQRHLYPCL